MKFKGNFINGQFSPPRTDVRRFVSENPGDLAHPVGEAASSVHAVDQAVGAANDAFRSWALLSEKKRASYILRFAKLLKQNAPRLSKLITEEMGKPLSESRGEIARVLAKAASAVTHDKEAMPSLSHRMDRGMRAECHYRPRGVLVILSPFNVPAYLALAQATSALWTGNTVIIKPSELTPFIAQEFTLLWQKAGLPKGVLNLVHGAGDIGSELVGHADINGVFFTGSWATGAKIRAGMLNQAGKILALEMGGKNAALILKDANVAQAVQETVLGAFMTTGQRCNSTSRIIVDKSIAAKFIGAFIDKVQTLNIGYGLEEGTAMGPLVSKKGYDHYLESLSKAPQEGFKVLKQGGPFPYRRQGYYVGPSVHLKEGLPEGKVTDDNYADNEVFGPDTAIYIVRNLEEAVELNNRPRYGLVTSVFTRSRTNYQTVLNRAQTGLVNWNVGTVRSSGRLPFGGMKQSGNDRPVGFYTPLLCTIPTASLERASA